ncbi:hypothetical protein [Paucibacter soli]|uniref:hypothetical protein n=1 Tax=Paucibacter soli TaxID=3133433 RepID=UPI00309E44C3
MSGLSITATLFAAIAALSVTGFGAWLWLWLSLRSVEHALFSFTGFEGLHLEDA